MNIGMIGLGKMGANMAERLVRGGHRVVGFDLNPDSVVGLVDRGAEGADSLEDLVGKLPTPRTIWIMVPSGRPVDATIESLTPLLDEGDIVIDGGNSNYKDTLRRAETCR
ncbi:MAG: NAD(P)-binding domain-containing protein, partial [Acidimicrobiia bacterium]